MTQVVNPLRSKMNIHKNYWIRILKDPSDGRELKMQFAEDLGFDCPLDAARYLENAEQTTFVGSWFLTDEEVEEMGWFQRAPVILFTDGHWIMASADDEGNDAGALFTSSKKMITIPRGGK